MTTCLWIDVRLVSDVTFSLLIDVCAVLYGINDFHQTHGIRTKRVILLESAHIQDTNDAVVLIIWLPPDRR
jgi:hypothetical protein